MAQNLKLPVQVRIKHTRHAYQIGNYLDLGPSGIMVPEVEAVVDEVVNAFYYPQAGKRSWSGTLRVELDERPDQLEYAAWWNAYGWLAIQIESVEAVINAGKLVRPGVDVFSFGPNDLLFSIEAHPRFPFRTLEDCVKHVLDQIKDTHVKVGVGAETPEDRLRYIDRLHKGPILPHERVPDEPYNLAPPPQFVDLSKESLALVRMGGVLFHHSQTLHTSQPNESDRWRRGYGTHWVTEDVTSENQTLANAYLRSEQYSTENRGKSPSPE